MKEKTQPSKFKKPQSEKTNNNKPQNQISQIDIQGKKKKPNNKILQLSLSVPMWTVRTVT